MVFSLNLLKAAVKESPANFGNYTPGEIPDNLAGYTATGKYQLTFMLTRSVNPEWFTSPPPPRATGPSPTAAPRRPSPPHHDGPQPRHPPRTTTHLPSSSSITSRSPRENHQRPHEPVLTPHHSGHDIPSAINSPDPPAGARSVLRTQRPGEQSAHPPTATDASLPDDRPARSH